VAVKIRLKRLGKIRSPQYRIVVVDSRRKRDGRVIEEIGKYHPKEEPSLIDVVSDRAQYWLGVGAQPTESVEAILKVTGDWQRFKGEPGAEGTLRTAEPRKDKTALFNEALKEAGGEPKGDAMTSKSSSKSEPKPGKSEPKAGKSEPKADATTGEKEEPAEVPTSETPEGAASEAEDAEKVTAEDAGKSES
jgi:small subunit ribosomal protein S16